MKENNKDTRGEINDRSNYRGDDESNKIILINALLKENSAVDDTEGFIWSIDKENGS